MGADYGGGVPDSTTFARTLSDLKRDGSNILLVGPESADAHVSVCRRLLGEDEDEDEPRYRLIVLTDGDATCTSFPDTSAAADSIRVIRQADAPSIEREDVLSATVDSEFLSALGLNFLEVVDEIEAEGGGLEPAQLRVCFDSVRPLLERHRSETVFRLLHVLTSRIRGKNGMGHFHLPLPRDNEYVRILGPLFDAVVEVRTTDGTVEQRWHLRDGDVTSDWIAV
jgi:hypothetical protein